MKRVKGNIVKLICLAAALLCMLIICGNKAYAGSVEGNMRSLGGPVDSTRPEKGIWSLQNGRWRFASADGEARNRWICIESVNGSSDWFCFDGQGNMCTGWQKSGSGNWYYLRETEDGREGAMEKGFILDPNDGRCYYMDPQTGMLRTGWVTVDGYSYYFAETGEDSVWYWDGAETKWKSSGTGRPYGSMYRSEKTPDGSVVDAQGRRTE